MVWTLTYEVRFYIIATLAMLAGSLARPFLIVWACLQFIWVLMTAFGYWPVVDIFSDGLSLDFILGVLIAYAPEHWRLPYPRVVALLALLIAFVAPAFFAGQLNGIENGIPRFLGMGIPAAIIVAAAVVWNRNGVKTPRVLLFIADISYSLYMWHWVVFMLTTHWFDKVKDTPLGFMKLLIAELIVTFIISMSSFFLIEKVCNQWGSKLANLSLFQK